MLFFSYGLSDRENVDGYKKTVIFLELIGATIGY